MARSSIYVDEIRPSEPDPECLPHRQHHRFGPDPRRRSGDRKLSATLEQQCAFMFLHLRQTVEAGSATVEDIVKVSFWMEKLQRKPVNDEWIKMFPDPASRPARQIMEVPMEAGVLIQCDFMAVIADD